MTTPTSTHLELLTGIAKAARRASRVLSGTSSEQKNRALRKAAELVRANQSALLQANAIDIKRAKEAGVKGSFLDRLELNSDRIEGMAKGLEQVAELPDPVGKILAEWERPNGLKIARVAIPLGVIGVIYESRPNVTADAGALCLKAGNAVILRCGTDSVNSSRLIAKIMGEALVECDLPKEAITLLPTQDRKAVGVMLGLHGLIDVIVPRGGRSLIERVVKDSKIPTFEHLDGNCHTYLHKDADPEKAMAVVRNAKLRRTGVCGATESLLIDESVVSTLLPKLVEAMPDCEFRGDAVCRAAVPSIEEATELDWSTEYLAAIVSVKSVSGIVEAIEHVNHYGSGHTDAIITECQEAAEAFLSQVDSAIVVHNASTQYADGGEFGMGAEIGIATGRLHARGPVGVEQLTTYKYQVRGNGQTRPV
jgi:glutamate-5-semialdehyde dehydrogenase